MALSASQDLLVQSDWRGVDLRSLIRSQLAHLDDLVGTRIKLGDVSVRVSPAAAQTLGMALHELATNAAKHGALSVPAGTVHITWSVVEEAPAQRFIMRWTEQGGPPVQQPSRLGFGHTVMKSAVEHGLDADVCLEYERAGVQWSINAPVDAIISIDRTSS
jgi:two-component sensor histidine kinase